MSKLITFECMFKDQVILKYKKVPFICYIASSVDANSIVLTLVSIASGIFDLMLDLN